MNKVTLLGRLTSDPELRQTQSGISSCRFTVAVDRRVADKNTGERKADFITCVAWRNTAEFISRYFSKGRMICLVGNLRNNNYPDKKYPDVTHYGMIVVVDEAYFADKKPQGPFGDTDQASHSAPQQSAPQQSETNDSMSYGNLSEFEEILSDGDVPF